MPVLTETEWYAVQPVVRGLPFRPLEADQQSTIRESLIALQIPEKRVTEVITYVSAWVVSFFLLFSALETDRPAGEMRRRGR